MKGLINVNKPKGITSFDVIRKLRKILKIKKIGHTGTLDPIAEGVLVVCLGRATKLASSIESERKIYRAKAKLGIKTNTYDITGDIGERSSIKIKKEDLEEVKKSFIGKIEQIPPMYSAIRYKGKKLYELARKGIEIERASRKVEIYKLDLIGNISNSEIELFCEVSKGTYIRSLINDIGESLGCFATMTSLIREEVGEFSIKDSCTIEEIENMTNCKNFTFIKSIEEIYNYKKIHLENEYMYKLFTNGNQVKIYGQDNYYRVYYKKEFIGLGKIDNNTLKFWKYLDIV